MAFAEVRNWFVLTVALAAILGIVSCSSSNLSSAPPTLSSIIVSSASPSVDVGGSAQFSANGKYSDGSTQDLTSTVTWTSSATNVATINSAGLLSALVGGSTKITAVSGSIRGSENYQVNGPSAIVLSPEGPGVKVGDTLQFSAKGTFSDGSKDITSVVTWSSSDANIAGVSSSGVASGVAQGVATITAMSGTVPGSTAINVVTTAAFSNSSLMGSYAFTLASANAQGLPSFEAGSINADGNGNITAGVEDINSAGSVQESVLLTGTYIVFPDGRGTVTLTATGQSARTFSLVLKSNSSSPSDNDGQLIESDGTAFVTGTLEKQDTSASPSGSFVFRVGGIDSSKNKISTVGTFQISSWNISGGSEGINDNGGFVSGAINPSAITLDSTHPGRATGPLGGSAQNDTYAIYIVNANKFNMITTDKTLPAMAGAAELSTVSSISVPSSWVFKVDIGGVPGNFWLMGQFAISGTSSPYGVIGVQDQDGSHGTAYNFGCTTGVTFSNGSGTLKEGCSSGSEFAFYMVSPTKMYLVEMNDTHAASGTAELQPATPTLGAVNGTYSWEGAEAGESQLSFMGQLVADGNGNLMGIENVSEPSPANPAVNILTSVHVTGTYAMDTAHTGTGRATFALSAPDVSSQPGIQNGVLYIITPQKTLLLGVSPNDSVGVLETQ